MQNETLVYHLEDKQSEKIKYTQEAKSQILRADVVEYIGSITHLDYHFKGEHSSEDIIEITEDLDNKQKENTS